MNVTRLEDSARKGEILTGDIQKQECRRCHRQFKPKKEDDRFGPRCARKQMNDHIEIKNTKGELVAVIV
jgi:NAD-dependent SIR2 family protein deacetylase